MDQVITRQEIYTVVIPSLHLPQTFFGTYIHIRADHQIPRAVMFTTDIGIAGSTLYASHFSIAEHRIALEQVMIMKTITT